MNPEQIFNHIFSHQNTFSFNRNFLKEKIRYYKEKGEMRPELPQDIFIYENYDAFDMWCIKNNKRSLFPDLQFKVEDWN
jgi:hypothetical protein